MKKQPIDFNELPVTRLQWTAFKLTHVEGYTGEQAAQIMNRKRMAVEMLVSRFRDAFPRWKYVFQPRTKGAPRK